MAKLSLTSVVVCLAVSVDLVLSGFASAYKSELGGGRPGFGQISFGETTCSAMSGVPDPKSGCCGRHAEAEGGGDEADYGSGSGDGEIGIDEFDDDGNEAIRTLGPDDVWVELDDNGIGGIDINYNNIFGGNNPWYYNDVDRNKRSADKNASDIAPAKYITAGKPAGITQYLWLVRLQVNVEDGNKIVGCGGSLVSSRHVITAAHCLAYDFGHYDNVDIVLAEYDTRTFPTDCVGRHCIKNLVMHPDKIAIHNRYESGKIHHDIGMMRLRGSAPYSDYIRPICLPPFNINTPGNDETPLAVAGWGRTESGESSPVKLHTEVQLVASRTCRRDYPDLTEGHLCAAGSSGQDSCIGDSGGPIMAMHEGNFYLVGLVSGKRSDAGCGSPVPTFNTNVYAYMKWIQDFMNN